MAVELTKSFPFSASHSSGGRSIGRNYTLLITVEAFEELREREMEAAVERELLALVHSRDLSEVEFLKGIEISDAALLRAFWARLAAPLRGFGTKRLALQRDARTVTTLTL